MRDTVKRYTTEIRDALGYLAAWTPATSMRLGDIGVMRDRVFVPQSSVSAFDINFGVRQDGGPVDFEYASRGAVSIDIHGGLSTEDPVATAAGAKAAVTVRFDREQATVLSCLGCVHQRIEDVLSLQEAILRRHRRGLWRDEWVVVSHVVVAESATILICDAKGAEISFEVSGDLKASGIRLGDASLRLTTTSVKSVSHRWVAAHGITPMFLAIGIDRGLFGSAHAGLVRRGFDDSEDRASSAILEGRFRYYDYLEP